MNQEEIRDNAFQKQDLIVRDITVRYARVIITKFGILVLFGKLEYFLLPWNM